MDDRAGYGVDEDVIANVAGDGADLIYGVESGLHRLARLCLTLLYRLLTLLCRLLTLLCRLLALLNLSLILLSGGRRRHQFLRRLEGHVRSSAAVIPGTHLLIALSRSHSVTHFRTVFFITVMTSFAAVFAAAVSPMFIAPFAVFHAVHVKEGDFFEVKLTFVFTDGLGSGSAGLFFIDQADAFLFCLGLGQIGHGGDLLLVAGDVALVEIVAAAGTGDDGDDDKGCSDFGIAGGENLIFDRNECILPFFLGHDEFLLSVIASS